MMKISLIYLYLRVIQKFNMVLKRCNGCSFGRWDSQFQFNTEIKEKCFFEKVMAESRAFLEHFFFLEKSPKKDVTLK